MLDELTPEQFAEHIIAEGLAPTGDDLIVRVAAYFTSWFINLTGHRKEGEDPVKPEAILPHLMHFLTTGTSDASHASPAEAMSLFQGRA